MPPRGKWSITAHLEMYFTFNSHSRSLNFFQDLFIKASSLIDSIRVPISLIISQKKPEEIPEFFYVEIFNNLIVQFSGLFFEFLSLCGVFFNSLCLYLDTIYRINWGFKGNDLRRRFLSVSSLISDLRSQPTDIT